MHRELGIARWLWIYQVSLRGGEFLQNANETERINARQAKRSNPVFARCFAGNRSVTRAALPAAMKSTCLPSPPRVGKTSWIPRRVAREQFMISTGRETS